MATSSEDIETKVKKLLTCSCCHEVLQEPQTLMQCFHSYCKKCLTELTEKQKNLKPGVTCLLCDTFSSQEQIQCREFLDKLLGLQSNSANQKHSCEQCDPDKPAEANWNCQDCHIALCDACRSQHLRIPLLKGHRILKCKAKEMVVDELVFCSTHANTPVELYCNQCLKIICNKCHLESHQKHEIVTGQWTINSIISKVDKSVKTIDGRLEELVKETKAISENIEDTQRIYSQSRDELDRAAERKINEIKSEQDRMKKILAEKELQQIRNLKDKRTKLSNYQSKATNIKQLMAITLTKTCNMSLLNTLISGELTDRLAEVAVEKPLLCELLLSWPERRLSETSWDQCRNEGLLGQINYMEQRQNWEKQIFVECNQQHNEEVLTLATETSQGNKQDSSDDCVPVKSTDRKPFNRKFFLKLQYSPLSKVKPKDLPTDLPEVILDTPIMTSYTLGDEVQFPVEFFRITKAWLLPSSNDFHPSKTETVQEMKADHNKMTRNRQSKSSDESTSS